RRHAPAVRRLAVRQRRARGGASDGQRLDQTEWRVRRGDRLRSRPARSRPACSPLAIRRLGRPPPPQRSGVSTYGRRDRSRVVRSVTRRVLKKHGEFVTAAGLYRALKRSEEHTSELQSRRDLVCRLLLEKKKKTTTDPAVPSGCHCGIETWWIRLRPWLARMRSRLEMLRYAGCRCSMFKD